MSKKVFANGNAVAGGIEFEPVITALHPIARDLAERQRQMPVTAAVFERDGPPPAVAEHHHRLPQQGPPERPALFQLTVICRDIPAVFHEHGQSLSQ